ncbi:hypothetical protein ACU8KH_01390 [Lachancea thermotolerans]
MSTSKSTSGNSFEYPASTLSRWIPVYRSVSDTISNTKTRCNHGEAK